MASLEQRNGRFRVVFRYAGQKYGRSLKTDSEKAAKASLARLEDNLRRLELGTLTVPQHADLPAFLLSDGRRNGKPKTPKTRLLSQLLDAFLDQIPANSIEQSSKQLMEIHVRHLKRVFGARAPVSVVHFSTLQQYVDKRSADKGRRGRPLSPETIKKEMATLRVAWNWARQAGHVSESLPTRGLRYPKTREKPPFQTWSEIERKISRGGLSEEEQADLWDCLFLTLPEISVLLKDVHRRAKHPFIYPMFAFAAHSGARRSEILRSRLDDIDLSGQVATVREKKRIPGKLTTRSVPLSPFLTKVLQAWISNHPGGNYTFCQSIAVPRSRKNRVDFEPLTRSEAVDHFTRTLAGTKWEKLPGWHVFRHSFCSNCAAAGIDQRIINAWVGHQTDEMVRRYRHLIPNQQQAAIRTVFRDAEAAVADACEAAETTSHGRSA